MNFEITFIDGEKYELDFDKALELVMKAICEEHGWEADDSCATRRRKRLKESQTDLAEELHYVPFAEVVDFLEPCPFISSSLDEYELTAMWRRPDLTEIKLSMAETTLEAYGW